jgi:uncharacterized membrane protein YeaQ/YmgE (transglycosylase-associated protein family)
MGTLVTLLIFGVIVGLISYALNPKPSQIGIIGALLLGTVGSQVGGIISNLILHGDIIALLVAMFMLTRVGMMTIGRSMRI